MGAQTSPSSTTIIKRLDGVGYRGGKTQRWGDR